MCGARKLSPSHLAQEKKTNSKHSTPQHSYLPGSDLPYHHGRSGNDWWGDGGEHTQTVNYSPADHDDVVVVVGWQIYLVKTNRDRDGARAESLFFRSRLHDISLYLISRSLSPSFTRRQVVFSLSLPVFLRQSSHPSLFVQLVDPRLSLSHCLSATVSVRFLETTRRDAAHPFDHRGRRSSSSSRSVSRPAHVSTQITGVVRTHARAASGQGQLTGANGRCSAVLFSGVSRDTKSAFPRHPPPPPLPLHPPLRILVFRVV